ncbi:MAG TPA: ABC transporter permease [Candidatus Acidoferrales bacterium]|jgi:predicted permease|nr:ABC transporter permease [Candidatus Acidoferrales bacterium]
MFQDVRFALRMIRRSPGFAFLVILCLTLGIGANTAVFSWIEGILLRPFPAIAGQDRLVVLGSTARGASRIQAVSWPDFLDFQKGCTGFESLIADRLVATTLSIGDRAERAPGSVVSANYFDALGVRPILGRGFLPEEDFGRGAHPVTVISHQLWRERFGSDPNVIGRSQILNGLPHIIVGVAPERFMGTFVGYSIQFWVPVSMQERFEPGGYKLEDRGARWIEGFARLKPGVTRAQAQAEISAVARRLEAGYPYTDRGRGIVLLPLWQSPFNSAAILGPTLGIAMAVVSLVLLIACANVGNLLLVRSLARRHEIAVRLAVGAGRARILRQLLTEGLIMSGMASGGGLVMAGWCHDALVAFFPPQGVTLNLAAQIDLRVLAFSAAVCLLSTVLFALMPAIQTSRLDLVSGLKAESSGVFGGGRRRSLARSALVLVQVSLSFILIVSAGLLARSLAEMRRASPGFATKGVLNASVDLFAAGYDPERGKRFQDELIRRVQALPGVESTAFARVTPFSYRGYSAGPIAIDGYQPAPDEQPSAEYNEVGPGYFGVLGIPLESGREFTDADNEAAPQVAIVNQTMANRYWPSQTGHPNPVGNRLRVQGLWLRVVGVARDSKYRTFLEPPKPFFYVPLRQAWSGQVNLHVRTLQPPETVSAALARQVRALDPNLALSAVSTMQAQIELTSATERIAGMLLGVFGILALLLAGVGLYGVMSYAVSQNIRELALRVALGASERDLLRLVLRQGLALTTGGIVLGAGAAFGLTRLVADFLYKVSPRDAASFAAAFAVMLFASIAACLAPARRAARIDPVRALRDA